MNSVHMIKEKYIIHIAWNNPWSVGEELKGMESGESKIAVTGFHGPCLPEEVGAGQPGSCCRKMSDFIFPAGGGELRT